MERSALEKLGDEELRKLVTDAQAVLDSRKPKEAPPVFAFGSGATSAPGGIFASGAGGGLFSGAADAGNSGGGLFSGLGSNAGAFAPAARTDTAEEKQGEEEAEFVKEEEVLEVDGWKPSMTAEVKDTVATGEEEEKELYKQRSKLFRFRDGEWKERGIGEAKLLKNPTSGKTRFLMRQEKTGKVVANHLVVDIDPYCQLKQNADSEKIWVWTAQDCAEDETAVEKFALKFGSKELAASFKEAYEAARVGNAETEKPAEA